MFLISHFFSGLLYNVDAGSRPKARSKSRYEARSNITLAGQHSVRRPIYNSFSSLYCNLFFYRSNKFYSMRECRHLFIGFLETSVSRPLRGLRPHKVHNYLTMELIIFSILLLRNFPRSAHSTFACELDFRMRKFIEESQSKGARFAA
jgi:hypothetical protein